MMKRAANAQISILRIKFKGQGLIIDMNAGDGNGVEERQGVLPFREENFQEYMQSEPSPRIADKLAKKCDPMAEVILCERDRARRKQLEQFFSDHAHVKIYGNHEALLKEDFAPYAWIFVFNDPCGPAGHGTQVLAHIAKHPRADFLIVVNELAIDRHSHVSAKGSEEEDPRIQGVRNTRERYVWMLDPEEWRRRLNRRVVCSSKDTINNPAFHGRVIVVSNYLADEFKRLGWRSSDGTAAPLYVVPGILAAPAILTHPGSRSEKSEGGM
jgi:hypothetical protein